MAGVRKDSICDYSSLDIDVQRLISEAVEARKYSHCPYSNFAVGAALLTENGGKIFRGCNIETSTFSPSICAERTAVFKAVSEGHLKFKAVAVVANQLHHFTTPCGVCRQVLSEFSDPEMDVYIAKSAKDKVLHITLSDLLPLAFVNFKIDSAIDAECTNNGGSN